MPFATRSDLLKRANARRLAQLAVPSDRAMIDDDSLRIAIDEGNLTSYSTDDQASIALALDAIDNALADADALILSYGIPATVQTTLLARLASTIALYYLQGLERMTDSVQKAYDGAVDMLKNHARGLISLIPFEPPVTIEDSWAGAEIESEPSRYGRRTVKAVNATATATPAGSTVSITEHGQANATPAGSTAGLPDAEASFTPPPPNSFAGSSVGLSNAQAATSSTATAIPAGNFIGTPPAQAEGN